MPTTSSRLGLAKPVTADDFNTAEIADNWQKVDDHPGTHICTLATRPTWGAAHEGMHIFETDTDLYWRWNGAAWERAFPKGRLVTPATRSSDLVEATGSFVNIAQLADVAVPAGNRPIIVKASWYSLTGDDAEIELIRDSTSLVVQRITAGAGNTIEAEDLPGSSGGTFDYTARLRTLGTSSTLECDSGAMQFRLYVSEG